MGIALWSLALVLVITGLACTIRYKLILATLLIAGAAALGLYAGSLLP